MRRMPADPAAERSLAPYQQALTAAGAVGIPLPAAVEPPSIDKLLEGLSGLLFSGGGDVDPRSFGEPAGPGLRDVDADRDECELSLARAAVQRGLPFLAVCRGLQVVNVALGGSLIQDLPRDLPGSLVHESQDGTSTAVHPVEVGPDSRLREILGRSRLTTNSEHHQAVRRLGQGLAATARTSDGVVEALEIPGHPFAIAVQWHPERMVDEPAMQALFRALVAEAGLDG